MEKLKPCPFCGGKAHIRKFRARAKDNNGNVIKGNYGEYYGMGCYTPDCICYMDVDERTVRFMFKIKDDEGRQKAIDRWNRRAADG